MTLGLLLGIHNHVFYFMPADHFHYVIVKVTCTLGIPCSIFTRLEGPAVTKHDAVTTMLYHGYAV